MVGYGFGGPAGDKTNADQGLTFAALFSTGEMSRPASSDRMKWLLLATLSLIWGSSFILMKRGLYHEGTPVLDPFQLASCRLFIAWIVLMPLLFRHARYFRAHWKPLMGTALLGNGLPAFLFAYAQTHSASVLAGMLNSLTPLFTLLIGVWLFRVRLRLLNLGGVLLGLLGALGIIAFREHGGDPVWSVYAVLPIVGALSYGFSGNIVKHGLYMVPAAAIAGLAISIVGPMGLLGILVTGVPQTLANEPHAWESMGYVGLLAIFGTGISLVLWNELIKLTSAVWASSVTYLMPVVAVTWGMLDGETFLPLQFLMAALILLGVYLVNQGTKAADGRT
jgi:drug/metabolite transporter (DMT)-like permease